MQLIHALLFNNFDDENMREQLIKLDAFEHLMRDLTEQEQKSLLVV